MNLHEIQNICDFNCKRTILWGLHGDKKQLEIIKLEKIWFIMFVMPCNFLFMLRTIAVRDRAKWLFLILYAYVVDDDGNVSVDYNTLSHKTGIPANQIWRYLKELKRAGLVLSVIQNGRGKANSIKIAISLEQLNIEPTFPGKWKVILPQKFLFSLGASKLNCRAKFIYVVLRAHADYETGFLSVFLKTLSKESGIPTEQICNYLRELKNAGFILSIQKNGRGRPNTIQITMTLNQLKSIPSTFEKVDHQVPFTPSEKDHNLEVISQHQTCANDSSHIYNNKAINNPPYPPTHWGVEIQFISRWPRINVSWDLWEEVYDKIEKEIFKLENLENQNYGYDELHERFPIYGIFEARKGNKDREIVIEGNYYTNRSHAFTGNIKKVLDQVLPKYGIKRLLIMAKYDPYEGKG